MSKNPSEIMYDLIITDMIMNVMNGDETSRRIREMKNIVKQPHIVALSANVLSDDKEICMNAGMCDFVSKPIKLQILHDIIANLENGHLKCCNCGLG
jgi:CheY-like chemotaxis protein